MTWRILELFSGLGAWRWAAEGRGNVVAAFDISEIANRVYALNHELAPTVRELATVRAAELAAHQADTWLLSPPCQPYCRMGHREDAADPRSQALLHLVEVLEQAPPSRLALENVEGFLGSEGHARLAAALQRIGLGVRAFRLCPTRFGVPNQRPRVYLVAGRRLVDPGPVPELPLRPIRDFLDAEEDPDMYLDPDVLARHLPGLDLVEAESQRSCCFIGGYGRKYVGSGSFLRTPRGIRRFSPREVARLLGLPDSFSLPPDLPREAAYKLLGNALQVQVAAWVLQALED